jgi:hypothetical protein
MDWPRSHERWRVPEAMHDAPNGGKNGQIESPGIRDGARKSGDEDSGFAGTQICEVPERVPRADRRRIRRYSLA